MQRNRIPAAQLLILSCMLAGAGAAATEAGPAADGKGLYAVCESCHGVAGEGNQPLNAPVLAGLDADYLARQLRNFRQGVRGADKEGTPGRAMRDMANLLSDESQVEAVARYVASLPAAPSGDATVRGDIMRGRQLYQPCAACHGEDARGNPALRAPALAIQADWYLLRQLEEFRSGKRGAAASDTDGAQMRAMAQSLGAESKLRDVVAYVRSLGSARNAQGAAPPLSSQCPASFGKEDGLCVFRSLYELYNSPQGHGGLRVSLPRMREAFTAEQIDLGRYLFFDPLLSADHSMACSSCHQPAHGFADGRVRSLGKEARDATGRRHQAVLKRNAPSLWNVGFLSRLFWDGRASSLEEQARGPLFAPDEMGGTQAALEDALNANPQYRDMFAQAFARSPQTPIRVGEVVRALAAFESSLVSFNSRYDRYAFGDATALSAEEIAGHNIFRGFVARCSQCHVPPLFASADVAVVGAPASPGQAYDAGVEDVTHQAAMRGAFKIPSLRNVALTAPYFQAGQLASLEDVVRFYNDVGGHAVPVGEHVQVDWHLGMKGPTLDQAEQRALLAFLRALTDESMMPVIPERVPSGLAVPGVTGKVARRSVSSPRGR